MAMNSVFGEIPGFPVDTVFDSREAVRLAGLHRHEQAGISGHYLQGADAIIVSGGYVDDEDFGDRIVYTGHGGREGKRQVSPQVLKKGNLALARAEELGRPVRVIRGAGGDRKLSPKAGYRYDGLFTVTSHWAEDSKDGPRIWRFVLEAADGGHGWVNSSGGSRKGRPTGAKAPTRATSSVQRIVRNSDVTQWVKDLYHDRCQICGVRLSTPAGGYSEGAHIRALGSPHHGPDTPDNVLCLCPNDHVLLDKGAYFLDAGRVYWSENDALVGDLREDPAHALDWSHADYHRDHFARPR